MSTGGIAMTRITLVKKINADGTPCRKCDDVSQRLKRDGVADRIDEVVVADERDPDSDGMAIAARYGVERAPFFIVERPGQAPQVYSVYMRLRREVLEHKGDERAEAAELMETAGLDFI
jgi:hypothetical protein